LVLASDYNDIIYYDHHDYHNYHNYDDDYDDNNNRAAYNDHAGTCYFYNCGSSS
jgi:hypothetical protein